VGYWGWAPTPNPQIPNPQSPIPKKSLGKNIYIYFSFYIEKNLIKDLN